MKVISSLTSFVLLCAGFTVSATTPLAIAQPHTDATGDRSVPSEEHISSNPDHPTVNNTDSADSVDFQLIGPSLLGESNGADSLDDLDDIASQINSVFDGTPESESDEFLPDGMVVRGSNGGVQVGGEL